MKRIVISLCCAVLMIVTCCFVALPASADAKIALHPYRWDSGYNITTELRNANVALEWSQAEPSPIENYVGSVSFAGDIYFAIGAGSKSYTINTNNFRVSMSYRTLPEKFEFYSNDSLILRWSYADPTNILIYQEQETAIPFDIIPISDIDTITFLFQWISINSADNGGLNSFYNIFGDYSLRDYSLGQQYYNEGYQLGIANGYYDGTQDGYASGYTDGLSVGAQVDLEQLKRDEYAKGYAQAEYDLLDSNKWGGQFLTNTFNAIWGGLNGFILFSTPNGIDVTLGGLLGSVIGISCLIACLKFFAGG